MPVAVTYEAGPTGYGLARALSTAGLRCVVAAPSRLPRPAGDRVKTDTRDAMLLAHALRSDLLTEVTVPSPSQEDARDLTRAREDARATLMSARHRLSKMLLRHGIVYHDGQAWTARHDQWLRKQRFTTPGARAAFDGYYGDVLVTTARRDRLDEQVITLANHSEFTEVTRRLACLRGINTHTAFALAVEIGDWHRFTGASIGSYLGLTPSESSSGSRTSRGPITKAGNTHARRLLIEAAWHHNKPYRPGRVLQQRWNQSTPNARVRADDGNRRLHHRWQQLTARKKNTKIANTAIARELSGWCWSLATMD